MNVINVDNLAKELAGKSRREFKENELNYWLAPQFDSELGSFRMLVTGRSGAGKTNLIISAILCGQIKFEHLYLYARDPAQSKYQVLLMFIKELEDEWERETGERVSFCTVATKPSEFLSIDEIDANKINLALIDDMLTEKNQSIIEEYFIRGRHRNMNCIYLTQDYHKTNITIRKQCQYYAIFGVSSQAELVQLSKEHSLDWNYKEFKQILSNATDESTDFLLIDRRTPIKALRLRKNWDNILDTNLQFHPISELTGKYLGKRYT